jgi:hypothetical protein
MLERMKSGALRNIESDLKNKDDKDLQVQIKKLAELSMDDILDVVEALKKAGLLDDFADKVPPERHVIGLAILTITPDLGQEWQQLMDQLGPVAREAVLKRVPAGSYTEPSPGDAGNPGSGDANKNQGWSGQQSAQVQYAGHWTIKKIDKKTKVVNNTPATDWTFQVQFAANYAAHPQDKSGAEIQALVQIGYDATTNQPSILGGAQGTLVQSFVHGVVQTSEFVQALAGAVTDGKSREGDFQAQVQAGGQVMVKISSSISIGAQIFTGVTGTHGSPGDLPAGGAIIIQGPLP